MGTTGACNVFMYSEHTDLELIMGLCSIFNSGGKYFAEYMDMHVAPFWNWVVHIA